MKHTHDHKVWEEIYEWPVSQRNKSFSGLTSKLLFQVYTWRLEYLDAAFILTFGCFKWNFVTAEVHDADFYLGCCKCNFDNSGDSFIFNDKWTKGAFSSCDIYLWWTEMSKKALRASLDIFWSFTLFFSSLAVKYHHVQLRNQRTKGIIIFQCPNFKNYWKYSKVFVDVLGTFNSFQYFAIPQITAVVPFWTVLLHNSLQQNLNTMWPEKLI